MVFTTGRIMLSLALLFVLVLLFFSFFLFLLFFFFFLLFFFFFFFVVVVVFSVLFSIVITSLREERADLCGSHASICLLLHALIPVLFLVLLVSGVGCGL